MKIINIWTKLNIKHWLWHVVQCWVDTWTFKKIKKKQKQKKKSWSDTCQLLFMVVSDLDGVNKNRPNWTKLTKIVTYLSTKSKLGLIW